MDYYNVTVVIPSLNPDEKLMNLVSELIIAKNSIVSATDAKAGGSDTSGVNEHIE